MFNVSSIGEEAFSGCLRLNNITLPDSVKELKSSILLLRLNFADRTIYLSGYFLISDCL